MPGDVCVEQQQSPYSPLVKPCPPVAPAGLSIKVNLSTDKVVEGVQLGQSLTFVLTQESVHMKNSNVRSVCIGIAHSMYRISTQYV